MTEPQAGVLRQPAAQAPTWTASQSGCPQNQPASQTTRRPGAPLKQTLRETDVVATFVPSAQSTTVHAGTPFRSPCLTFGTRTEGDSGAAGASRSSRAGGGTPVRRFCHCSSCTEQGKTRGAGQQTWKVDGCEAGHTPLRQRREQQTALPCEQRVGIGAACAAHRGRRQQSAGSSEQGHRKRKHEVWGVI